MPKPPKNDTIKIDPTLKGNLTTNEEKQRQLRESLIKEKADSEAIARQKRDAVADAEFKALGGEYQNDGKGGERKALYWDQVFQKGQEFRQVKGIHANIQPATLIMEIVEYCSLLNKALFYDDAISRSFKFVWNETIGKIPVVGQTLEAVGGGLASLPGMAVDAVFNRHEAPELVYSLKVDATGKLSTTVEKNGVPLTDEQKMGFDTGLIVWAEKRGCTFDPATQIMKDDKKAPMTFDKFRELNKDDEHGLTAFFEDRYDLHVSSSPRP